MSSISLFETRLQLDVKKCDLSHSKFDDANLSGLNLHNINLSSLQIDDANMTGLSICNATLANGRIHHATLNGLEIDNCMIDGMRINGILVSELLSTHQGLSVQNLEKKSEYWKVNFKKLNFTAL